MKRDVAEKCLITLIISALLVPIVLLQATYTSKAVPSGSVVVKCMEPWQVTFPGSTLTFNLQIMNNGTTDDVYILYIDNPPLPNENWTSNFYLNGKRVKSIGLLPHQSSLVILEVTVPENAPAGDYSFRVNVDGKKANASIILTITVESFKRKIDLVCPFKSQSILTGQVATYPIKIINSGERTEKIFLQVNRTSELMLWELTFSDSQVTLQPKESAWITLTVEPPTIVMKGVYTILIIASTEDGEVTVTLPLTTEVRAEYILEIVDIQPINPQVTAGERIEIVVTVRNIGHSPLSKINLIVNSSALSNIFVIPVDVLALEPKQTVTFYVKITPNVNTPKGDYMVYIQAVSAETKSSVRGIVVSVVSAIPWFWITIALTVIATSVAVLAIQRVVSRFSLRIRR
ncbi:hypothetical protein CW702_01615 [Candidatus Bathyarchaeota archaeon]|nr:MAG: hypothetical protein CW702_01615 [Candidatus Bathyarchaeota archaeon]